MNKRASNRAAWRYLQRVGPRWGIFPCWQKVRGEWRVFGGEKVRYWVKTPGGTGYAREEIEPIFELGSDQPFARVLSRRLKRHERRVADRLAQRRAREEIEAQKREEDFWQDFRPHIAREVRRHGVQGFFSGR